ncbi:MAG: alpha-amylase family glycosyl hydrolase, partial [Acetobacteraceae bacterium]
PDRVLIGEIYLPVERLVAYYGMDMKGAHLPFNFQLVFAAWDAAHVARIIAEYEAALPEGGWPNWVLGNHDQKRIATRIGAAQARVAAMLLLTLRGTPTLYYGDELGLENVPIPPDRVQDPWELREPGLGLGRDPARTPMAWDGSDNAGFTAGTPWLPLHSDWQDRNVADLTRDPASILTLYRRLIALRHEHAALRRGQYMPRSADDDVLIFERVAPDGERLLVALNMGREAKTAALPSDAEGGIVLLSTCLDRAGGHLHASYKLRSAEGVVIRLAATR